MEHIPDTELANMPLHDITERLGTDGLFSRFALEVSEFTETEQEQINWALLLAYSLHHNQQREREPYINHILRVSIRVMHHYEVIDVNVICASLLHDSVEDHAKELAAVDLNEREVAYQNLATWFNSRVADLVKGVTNPEFEPSKKNEQYLEHLKKLVKGNPWLLVIKLSDFTDNAGGIIYIDGEKARRLGVKYLPAVDIFRQALTRGDIPLENNIIQLVADQLDLIELITSTYAGNI